MEKKIKIDSFDEILDGKNGKEGEKCRGIEGRAEACCLTAIENEEQYEAAVQRVEELLPLVNDNTPTDDPNYRELVYLSNLVADYSEEHYAIGEPDMKDTFKVVDTETGNYCLYEGGCLANAFDAIKDNAKVEDEYAEDFTDADLFDLYRNGERIWCGATGSIEELTDLCHPDPRLGKSTDDYLNASFCWGSDPGFIETVDEAVRIFLMTNKDGVECRELEGEDRETAMEKIGLSGEEAGKVYACGAWNQEKWLIRFDGE